MLKIDNHILNSFIFLFYPYNIKNTIFYFAIFLMMIVSFINYLYPLFMRYYFIKVCAFFILFN